MNPTDTMRAVLKRKTARSHIRARPAGTAIPSLAALVAAGCSTTPTGTVPPPPPPPPGGFDLAIETVVTGLEQPVFLTAPPGDGRLFIVEQLGRIRIVSASGQLLTTPFLDLAGQVDHEPEGGLLTMAFHPRFASNGFVYVYFTAPMGGDTRVVRYRVTASDANRLDPSSAQTIFALDQPFGNHNGGMLQFGADGMLYIFLGDGGGAGDPGGNGQNPSTLLGSILRLDVDGGSPFAIPGDNPFVGVSGRDEIWAYGVRNPWRSTFDVPGGLLYVADVGQNRIEEVNVVPMGAGGLNFGWNTMEGSSCFAGSGCSPSGLTLPVEEYTHADGCSITGGYVYRGTALPEIQGHYFYSDFCTGFLRSFRASGGQATDRRQWDVGNPGSVSSFGVDGAGELYIVDLNGTVRKLIRG